MEKREFLVDHIIVIKIIDLGFNEFHLTRGV
jgi:hypothetical protein